MGGWIFSLFCPGIPLVLQHLNGGFSQATSCFYKMALGVDVFYTQKVGFHLSTVSFLLSDSLMARE
jgi:hypothetical protein